MFYCNEILNQRRGRFAVIWLAATKGRKLSRREVCGVNINHTCLDILKYLSTKGVKHRLSLYLSTQLMYGTLIIYHRQHTALFEEVSNLLVQFRSLKYINGSIQLQTLPSKDRVTMSDALCDIEEGFGEFRNIMIDIEEIPEVNVWNRDMSFDRPIPPSLLPPSELPVNRPSSVATSSSARSSKITKQEERDFSLPKDVLEMRETSADGSISMLQPQPDLPSFDPQGLEMIINYNEEITQIPTIVVQPETDPSLDLITPHRDEAVKSDVPGAPQRAGAKEADADITIAEEQQPPPPKRPRIIPLVLPPVESHRRKYPVRYLNIDADICLDSNAIRRNLTNTKNIVKNFQDVLVDHPLILASSVKELFKKPARKELNHKLLFPLWARNLKQVEDFSETESDRKRPIFCVPELTLSTESPSSPSTDKPQDVSSVEIPRPSSSPQRQTPGSSKIISPLSSKAGRSRDSLTLSTPRRKRKTSSLSDEDSLHQIERPSFNPLDEQLYPVEEELQQDIPSISISSIKSEEAIVSQFRQLQDYILLNIEKQTRTDRWTTFRQICPPGQVKKRRAAHMFYTLLMAHQKCLIRIKQKEPYGEIYLRRRAGVQ